MTTKNTGGDVNYYLVDITDPKRLAPYKAEAEDIIEALGMTFAEGNIFKALWRSCAARTLGVFKTGMDKEGIYDGEKIEYYSKRLLAQRKRLKEKDITLNKIQGVISAITVSNKVDPGSIISNCVIKK